MHKDEALARVREDLGRYPDLERVCEAIVKYVSTRSADMLQRITFRVLSSAAGLSEIQDVIPAVQYLSGSRVPLFEVAYMFIDGDEEFDVSSEELAEARSTHIFYHPDLGEPVDNFEKSIYVYFRLTPEAVQLCVSKDK